MMILSLYITIFECCSFLIYVVFQVFIKGTNVVYLHTIGLDFLAFPLFMIVICSHVIELINIPTQTCFVNFNNSHQCEL